jgi:hypothetical protein
MELPNGVLIHTYQNFTLASQKESEGKLVNDET